MIRSLEVATVKVADVIGYQIHGLYRDCSDSLYEVIAHAAVFRDKARAERFLAKVRASGRIDWQFWGVPQNNFIRGIEAVQGRVAPFSVL
jgi:hypothetical protein